MSAVRVVSYNVLCSHLAPADRFCHCKPNDLAAPVRLKRILKALDVEVAAGSVLCLQEVGREWSGELHKYFSDKGFHFIHSGYGEPYNDYMGSFCDSNNSTSNYDLNLFSKLFRCAFSGNVKRIADYMGLTFHILKERNIYCQTRAEKILQRYS
jgi:mRNA deadenylase 3'-5' endonuclease subunit Ccr4